MAQGRNKPGAFKAAAGNDPVAYVEMLLKQYGTITEAAEQTGFSRQTLYYALNSHGREIVRTPRIRKVKKP